MVDEKLADEVWITVVATGYGERRAPPPRARAPPAELPESADAEPRVTRTRREPVTPPAWATCDVPEFLPRA